MIINNYLVCGLYSIVEWLVHGFLLLVGLIDLIMAIVTR
jgi:hypothetical protein